jgi:alpha-glucosidase
MLWNCGLLRDSYGAEIYNMLDGTPWSAFLASLSSILAFLSSPLALRVAIAYCCFALLYVGYRFLWLRPKDANMARSPVVVATFFVVALMTVVRGLPSTVTPAITATTTHTSFRTLFTVPSSADDGQMLLPNIYDPQSINAQRVCPGYKASNVVTTPRGLTADLTLAGPPCNVYGNEVRDLKLTVEHQSADRLHIEITPTYIGPANSSWFILPEVLIPKPAVDADEGLNQGSDLEFSWNNEPSFSFTIRRVYTGDVLFSTEGSKLVFEDQFIEFSSSLPENYNLYGLGEVIHGLRMGDNFTRTLWAADIDDPPDMNIYGTHPFYLDTRYYSVDDDGKLTFAPNATDATKKYKSFSHGVFPREHHMANSRR